MGWGVSLNININFFGVKLRDRGELGCLFLLLSMGRWPLEKKKSFMGCVNKIMFS